ncbi:MAG: Rieske (2Fe-2S) protein [Polyangiales bacterium]
MNDEVVEIALSELDQGRVVARPLGRDAEGRPFEALVLRDVAGRVRAYRNLCQHIPLPLDGGSKSYLDATGGFLLCGLHGALYRREDGLCVRGPCEGESLEDLDVEVDGDRVRVRRRASSPPNGGCR